MPARPHIVNDQRLPSIGLARDDAAQRRGSGGATLPPRRSLPPGPTLPKFNPAESDR
jgi:hypothetical protein